jgi:predicted RNase H-like nuclease
MPARRGGSASPTTFGGYFGRDIQTVVAAADQDGALSVVAIDIPIGLPTAGPRQADALARALVGRRSSSVFTTPVRAALAAGSHAEATAISVQATGRGLNQQAYALGSKILEVDEWARTAPQPVIEVHPEVSFATLAAHPLQHPKSTWSGSKERRRLLAYAGIVVPAELGVAGEMAGTDDVLDAAVVSWTALRYARGEAACHPATPELFGDGHEAAIWA